MKRTSKPCQDFPKPVEAVVPTKYRFKPKVHKGPLACCAECNPSGFQEARRSRAKSKDRR